MVEYCSMTDSQKDFDLPVEEEASNLSELVTGFLVSEEYDQSFKKFCAIDKGHGKNQTRRFLGSEMVELALTDFINFGGVSFDYHLDNYPPDIAGAVDRYKYHIEMMKSFNISELGMTRDQAVEIIKKHDAKKRELHNRAAELVYNDLVSKNILPPVPVQETAPRGIGRALVTAIVERLIR